MKDRQLKTIIITGTHLTPAVELVNQLQSDPKINWNIHYIGRLYNSEITKLPSIESQVIPGLKVKFHPIRFGKHDRRYFPNTIKSFSSIFSGLLVSSKLIKKIHPDIVVSFGGYISVPVIINSWLKKIPSITHEQTLTNSLTTKINSFFVKKIALSFDNPKQLNNFSSSKIAITGNLLRSQIYNTNSQLFSKLIDLKKNIPIIYITAGNQGSELINNLIVNIYDQIKNYTIIHQTGLANYKPIKKFSQNYTNYHCFKYIDSQDIGWVLNNADIIISRSGANTCQEIISLKKKSILIPLPQTQQNEQYLNALWVKNQLPKHTVVLNQNKLNSNTLIKAIIKLSKVKIIKNFIKPTSNKKLLKLIHDLI